MGVYTRHLTRARSLNSMHIAKAWYVRRISGLPPVWSGVKFSARLAQPILLEVRTNEPSILLLAQSQKRRGVSSIETREMSRRMVGVIRTTYAAIGVVC